MARSRIGPFALEAPLSRSSASGQLFRGLHLEQRKLAAIRIFAIPLGLTPESRQAYSGQLEQLKQLRHRGIVRCYGGGFDSRQAYLAYQLVEGESLDQVLARRERLPWETAIDYSQQLAEALQYAHQMGWIHGRLKPDKVLVATDGTIKIGDWRREAISTMLGARPGLEEKLFAAPEVLQGQPADEKSDLYSVGAMMYLMLTGQPPFQAAEEDLQQVVLSKPPQDVGAQVMDCPVWLSAIVMQLLNKDPKQRPFSATALLLAFKEAQRRQSEGVGVLQHAASGFSPLQLKADRDEAEKILGLKPKRSKKKTQDTSFWESGWVLGLALVAAIAAIVWFLLPLSESTLRARAEKLLPPESEEWQDWNEARDAYLVQLTQRFPEGTSGEWAASRIEWVDAREHERKLQREDRLNRRQNWSDADRQYWQGRGYEEFGDLLSALDRYRAVIALYADQEAASPVVFLADEGRTRIREKGRIRSQLAEFVSSKLREADAAYSQAKLLRARQIWESIVELYAGNQELADLVQRASQNLDQLKNSR